MALTSDTFRSHSLHQTRLTPYPVKAGAAIYAGALVCVDSGGLAVPAADAAGLTCVGVAWCGCDNTAGSDGQLGSDPVRFCEAEDNGAWSFAFSGTPPVAGQDALIVDDDNLTVDATANNVRAGRVTEPDPDGSGRWFVDLER